MIKQRHNRLRDAIAGLLLTATIGLMTAAAVDVQETFSSGDVAGWRNRTSGTSLQNIDESLQFTFNDQGLPASVTDVANMQLGIAVRLTNLVFRFRAHSIDPSALKLWLHASTTAHTWTQSLALPGSTNWCTYTVPVHYDGKWSIGPGGSEALFAKDLLTIDQVGVEVRRHGSPDAQVYSIDDFTLQGLAITPGDRDLDGMSDDWETQHAFDATNPNDAALDSDGDGMRNYAEFRAGTDPRNAASALVLDIAYPESRSIALEGVVLKWASVSNRSYAVWRTDEIGATPYTFVKGQLLATPPRNAYVDVDATNHVRQFYVIEVEP